MQNRLISISKEELNSLPLAKFRGEIHLISDNTQIDEALKILRTFPIVGFDTETRPSFKKGENHNVALIQISSESDCFLFRLNKIGFDQRLIDYLEDQTITKIGLSLSDDFHNLKKLDCSLTPRGFIDLQNYVKDFGIHDKSLTKIYAILFGNRISKGQRLTNWEADALSELQQDYAALDAQACLEIYDYLRSGNFNPLLSPYLKENSDNETLE